MNKLYLVAGLIGLGFLIGFSQETEQALYQRKSVTYIDALWLMDQSVRNLPPDRVAMVLQRVNSELHLGRFDYNPVPQSLITDFVAQANGIEFPARSPIAGGPDLMLDSITAILQRTVVPRIIAILDSCKEVRAGQNVTEAQRNSFIADKAKSLGITMDDVNAVMNSAFIYLPLVRRYETRLDKDSSYTASVDLGIVWFKIATTTEGETQAKVTVKKFSTSTGFSRLGKVYASQNGPLDYKDFAFWAAVKNGIRNLVVATQEMAEFRLGAQVMDKRFERVGFELGKNEGLVVDDKYRIVEYLEESGGVTTKKNRGWVMVSKVADSTSKEGYKSWAQIISGAPYTGVALSEFPRIPIDLVIKGKSFPFVQTKDTVTSLFDSLSIDGGYGFGADVRYNVGRKLGIRQLFLGFGYGMGLGSAKGAKESYVTGTTTYGQAEISSVYNMSFELYLIKKFYIRRLALVLEPLFGYQRVSVLTDKWTSISDTTFTFRLTNSTMGFGINGGLEFALTPALSIGGSAVYLFYPKSSDWDYEYKKDSGKYQTIKTIKNDLEIDQSGLRFEFYLTWSPPALAFDPLDAVRGLAR